MLEVSIRLRAIYALLVSFVLITTILSYGYLTKPEVIVPHRQEESPDLFDPRLIKQPIPTNNPKVATLKPTSVNSSNLQVNGVIKDGFFGTEKVERSVAVGIAITTRGHGTIDFEKLKGEMPFFNQLLPSFCRTCSLSWDYHFYLAHDDNDPFFSSNNANQLFSRYFYGVVAGECSEAVQVDLHVVACGHNGMPSWAQNDAMMAAYMDGIAYYYRVNDDTVMETTDWTEKLVDQLLRFNPPNVGVSGPWFRDGNIAILTHDFVHRTHIDIFGFYYPRVFTDWFADDWITGVYWPERCRKVPGTKIRHTMARGSRYVVHFEKANRVAIEVEVGKSVVRKWITGVAGTVEEDDLPSNGTHIVAMALPASSFDHLYGVLRYGQLLPIIMKGWSLRVYLKNSTNVPENEEVIPPAIKRKLEMMNVEVITIDERIGRLSPDMWHLSALMDVSIDRVLLREANTRPSDRERFAIKDWIKSETICHCIRDHPKHADAPLMANMIGVKPAAIIKILGATFINEQLNKINSSETFLKLLWSQIYKQCRCHDSVSCKNWPSSEPFPVLRGNNEYVGQAYDINDIAEDVNTRSWADKYNSPDCVFIKDTGFTEQALRVVLRRQPVLWSQDYHVTPVMDMKSLLIPLGIKVIDKSLSFYCNSVGTCAKDLRIITQENGMRLTSDIIDQFYKTYKNSEDMKAVTSYVCTLPVAMCEAFIPFNKSIIIISTIRYEQGRPEPEKWTLLNKRLIQISSRPDSIVAANNLYDAKYIQYFTGISPFVVPNACEYLRASYSPTRSQFLVTPIHSSELHDMFYIKFDEVLMVKKKDIMITPMREMYPQYLFSDLTSHPGIIYLPYQISMSSLTEQYRMNIPMFFPSIDLAVKWHLEYQFIRQRTWDGYREKKSTGSTIKGVDKNMPDPNNDIDESAIRYWLQFADFYQWPHLVYYDSIEDLVDKLSSVNLTALSARMNDYNTLVKKYVRKQWSDILVKTLS